MSERQCHHPDVRKFDGVRCCLACGEAVFETVDQETFAVEPLATIPYKYTRLDYKLGLVIRVLDVHPGGRSDHLRCDVIHVNLEDEPDYEAVSYTWTSDDGDATLSHSIYCGGNKHISVTVNCDKALRQLRRRGLKRRLWIDAVCIDQTNVNERNHQVGLMDRIYSQARNVRICISEPCFSDEFSNYKKFFQCLQNGSIESMGNTEAWLFPMMRQLFAFRYFTRAWVIQEVALARAVYLLVNDNELLLSRMIMEQLTLIATQNNYQIPAVLRTRLSAYSMPFTSIITCLRAGATCECIDARDKVFAVCSLMDARSRSLIPVDYTLDVAAVHASAVIALVTSVANLDILSYAAGSVERTRSGQLSNNSFTLQQFKLFLDQKDFPERTDSELTPALPMEPQTLPLPAQFSEDTGQFSNNAIRPWRAKIEVRTTEWMTVVPDTRFLRDRHTSVVFSRKPNNLPEWRVSQLSILPCFQVRAHFIDKELNGSFYSHLHRAYQKYNASSIGAEIRNKRARLGEEDHWILPFFIDGHDIASAYWDPRSALYAPTDEYSQNEMPGYNLDDLIKFATIAVQCGPKNEIFTTAHSVGFTPHDFRSGDEIWAIDGAKVPFILRKFGPKRYRIVGECYLWAALELDYWNPGTRKGRWSENTPAHKEQQTHIIEIH